MHHGRSVARLNYVEKNGKRTLLDFEDALAVLASGAWINFTSAGYVMLKERDNRKSGFHYLHRWLIGAEKGQYVDHKNGDKTDNRRSNLRLCTQGFNLANKNLSSRNTSGYKGVSWDKQRSKWRSRVIKNRKYYHCGFHVSAELAARAYDAKARELFGEFASLNFPQEVPHSD